MRFGMFVPQGWSHDLAGIHPAAHWDVMKGLAQHADAGPWESIWVNDHFHALPTPPPDETGTHEAWSLMAAFGAVTGRVRLGQVCTCIGFRNPAYLAKVAATCDIVSGGRVEMCVGAGWDEAEWTAYGYGFPPARDRLGMLEEGVAIMRQAWTTGRATLRGKHYQVEDAIVRPLPLQDGGIPLWIAGQGEKVTLRIAARYARYTNFDGSPEGFARKSAVLAQHCRDVGTDFDAIVRSTVYYVMAGSTESEVEERIAAHRARLAPVLGEDGAEAFVQRFLRNGSVASCGTPEQIVERLEGMQRRGLAYGIFVFPGAAHDRSSLELFEREVIPALS
ncbi:TIGR03560 family F420-dependent LLM class oxidoreductase [Pseudonocardia xinjiangensis]|uniref:TIGR03560 family F420-dependent LLM class oxidoreductase n=1 Tax=Pseudonocardia xinjiangensis TaxID=75289 RepID=UPI003D8F0B2D